MITVRTLARLTPFADALCPALWLHVEDGKACPLDVHGIHSCVGDDTHLGKHVCRCGDRTKVSA